MLQDYVRWDEAEGAGMGKGWLMLILEETVDRQLRDVI